MKIKPTSTTAFFIAESAVYISANHRLAGLMPPRMLQLSKYFADSRPAIDKLGYFAKRSRLLRPFFNALENLVIPGIQLHYLVRKRRIEELARAAISDGVEQVVVLGAGFDTLALRLHEEFPRVSFIEADHPATQRIKCENSRKRALAGENLAFIPVDLARADFSARLRQTGVFRESLKTLFIAEGLLMYLNDAGVRSIFDFIREHSGEGGLFAFTFMEKGPGGRIAFRNSSSLVDLWLKYHGEPFKWGLAENELNGFLRQQGFGFGGLDNYHTFRERYLKADDLRRIPLAEGESLCLARVETSAGIFVNDIHSKLNETEVLEVLRPQSAEEVQAAIDRASQSGIPICVAGGFHSMGAQQFLTHGTLLDMRGMDRVLNFDRENMLIEVESGIMWNDLIDYMVAAQEGLTGQVGIRQKQTGADRLTVGGALSSNIHGRGLTMKPIIDDVESFRIVCADGSVKNCNRGENAELFCLAIGGYGLFGIIVSVTLCLSPRQKVERVVLIETADDLPALFRRRIAEGFTYGDFQFAIAPENDDFLRKGVFSCYRPAPEGTPVPAAQKELAPAEWRQLLLLAHTEKQEAFELYSSHYLSTHGQIYWSDTHQLSTYINDYHSWLDEQMASPVRCSEMITEVYVPLDSIPAFLAGVRTDFRENGVNLIYGTIRLIKRDGESFLAWARGDLACIVFNLHVEHSPAGIEKAAAHFRRLIGRAIEFGGSFYLTYHRWATREQLLACYPQLPEFLEMKTKYDPSHIFQSDWLYHIRLICLEHSREETVRG